MKEFFAVLQDSTVAGLIDWRIEDLPPKMEPHVPNIGDLPAFNAEIGDHHVVIYAFWKGWSGADAGRRLVFRLELDCSDGESTVSSNPHERCLYEEGAFDLFYTYLVVLWEYNRRADPELTKRIYILGSNGLPLDFFPLEWSMVDIIRFHH